VRLDHLLSKEHSYPVLPGTEASSSASVRRWFAHGWNVDYSASVCWWVFLVLLRRGTGVCWRIGCRARCWVSEGTAAVRFVVFGAGSGVAPSSVWCVTCGWLLFENCTVDASICGQVFKGARWMPWYQEPMKDVGGRDRPRGAVNRAVIRGCPNGETRQSSWAVTCT
jgi:hypothetical protein